MDVLHVLRGQGDPALWVHDAWKGSGFGPKRWGHKTQHSNSRWPKQALDLKNLLKGKLISNLVEEKSELDYGASCDISHLSILET